MPSKTDRSKAAKKAARTRAENARKRSEAAKKAAQTRAKASKVPELGDEGYPQPAHSLDQDRAADLVQAQTLRRQGVATPTKKVGKVEVVALPERLDVVPVESHKRDTILKDRLRAEGKLEEVEPPWTVSVGGNWGDHA